jgi:hypothetical protein
MIVARHGASTECCLEGTKVMGTLEQELEKIHDAGIGVSITWLRDSVDLQLVHKNGVVAVEGSVEEVADVLPWLEGAIKKHFPEANYDPAARRLPVNPHWAIRAMRAGNGR